VSVVGVVGALLAVGLLIVVHELGHFLACRWVGVRVERFSIGFGPALVSWKPGETEYVLGVVPLGGYVKMAGEEPSEGVTPAPDEFFSQPASGRALIIVAGVVMNAILAIVCFIIAFKMGVTFPKPEIGHVTPGGPADEAGLRSGDEIVAVGGWRDVDYPDVLQLIALSDPAKGIDVSVRRDGSERTVRLYPAPSRALGMPVAGFNPAMSLRVGALMEGFPAQAAGIKPNDLIVAIDGAPVPSWPHMQQTVQESRGKELTVTVERENSRLDFTVTPEPTYTYELGAQPSVQAPEVAQVAEMSPAERAGLQEGDRILAVEGREAGSWSALDTLLAEAGPGSVGLTVRRGEDSKVLAVVVPEGRPLWDHLIGVLGQKPIVGSVEPGGPAEAAGLTPGTEVTDLGSSPESLRPLRFWEQLEGSVSAAQGGPIVLRCRRGEESILTTVTPRRGEPTGRSLIGIEAQPKRWERKAGLFGAIRLGTRKSMLTALQVYLFVRRVLFTRTISSEQIAGPITIGYITYKAAATSSWSRLLYLLGIVGVNLALINLFPLPILDGGHLAVIALEKVKGSPVSPRALAVAQYVGLALIISLFLLVTYNDITRNLKMLLGG